MFGIMKMFALQIEGKNNPLYVRVFCRKENPQAGRVVDFEEIKKAIINQTAGKTFKEIMLAVEPTLENFAFWISEYLEYCYKVEVQDGENIAWYEKDN